MVHRGSVGIGATVSTLSSKAAAQKRRDEATPKQSREMSDGGGQGRGDFDLYLLCINT